MMQKRKDVSRKSGQNSVKSLDTMRSHKATEKFQEISARAESTWHLIATSATVDGYQVGSLSAEFL